MDWGFTTTEDYLAWMAEKGSSRSVARRLATQSTTALRNLWNRGTRDPQAFYKEDKVGEAYIGDLTQWHASGTVDEWFQRVAEFLEPRQRVLDFGAGIGTYSLLSAEMGCAVEACEVNEKLREYILWRSKRHSLGMSVTDKLTGGEYDVALCLDVIEHVVNPSGLVLTLASVLKKRGKLILTWTFHNSEGMHPMHHGPEALPGVLTALDGYFRCVDLGWPAVYERR